MSRYFSPHYSEHLLKICQPLRRLNITYFSHVHVDKNNLFSAISTNPHFSEYYIKQKFYNADIHMAAAENIQHFVVWDSITVLGKSAELYSAASEFGVKHVFTMIKKDRTGCHFYHFANESPNNSINQVYINNIDLLELFVQHFQESLKYSKELTNAYSAKLSLNKIDSQPIFQIDIDNNEARSLFLQDIVKNCAPQALNQKLQLTSREIDCMHYIIQGYTAQQMAEILNISHRTVEQHIASIKQKMGVRKKSELTRTYFLKNHLLDKK